MMLAARLRAIIRQRCPVCLQGAMFRGRFEMSATCPVCGHRFEREPGFFQGAMYVSYGIGIVYFGVLAILANAFLVRTSAWFLRPAVLSPFTSLAFRPCSVIPA